MVRDARMRWKEKDTERKRGRLADRQRSIQRQRKEMEERMGDR